MDNNRVLSRASFQAHTWVLRSQSRSYLHPLPLSFVSLLDMFSLGGNTPQTGGSALFGGASTTTQPQQPGSLFGGSSSAQAKPAANLFGGTTTTQSQPSASLFGSTTSQAPPSSNLFGGSTTTTQSQPAAGLFGSNPTQSQPSTNLLGNLGSSQAQQQQGAQAATGMNAGGNSLFGRTGTSNAPAGQTTSAPSLFGGLGTAPTQAQQPTAGGLFGGASGAAPASQPLGQSAAQATAQNGLSQSTNGLSQSAYFDHLLERGRKRNRQENGTNQFGDVPSLQLGLGDIARKVQKLSQGGAAPAQHGRDTRAYVLYSTAQIIFIHFTNLTCAVTTYSQLQEFQPDRPFATSIRFLLKLDSAPLEGLLWPLIRTWRVTFSTSNRNRLWP